MLVPWLAEVGMEVYETRAGNQPCTRDHPAAWRNVAVANQTPYVADESIHHQKIALLVHTSAGVQQPCAPDQQRLRWCHSFTSPCLGPMSRYSNAMRTATPWCTCSSISD